MSVNINKWIRSLSCAGRPDEYEVKQLLALTGIAVPRGVRLMPDDKIVEPDFDAPFAVKVCSADILHKTDRGGVILGVTQDDLGAAVGDIREKFKGAPVLVEEMLKYSGTEFIVGGLVDSSLGPAVMVGSGGVLTELIKDVSFRLAPCSEAEAQRMINELAVAPLFKGFRGIELDAAALAKIITTVSELEMELGDKFGQLDINPLVNAGGRFVALDAKLILSNGTED